MDLTLRAFSDLSGVNPADWDGLDHGASPFLEYGFLRALERSGSIGRRSGWQPVYLAAYRDGQGAGDDLLGAVPAFIKTHSYGEYIFDWGWAHGAEQAGIRYYPKLVIAAPVTPATGRRILLRPDLSEAERDQVRLALVHFVRELADETQCSGIHWLFCTKDEQEALSKLGFVPRASFQFHWHNPGYRDFDDFLSRLSSRKRKQLRKERRKAQAAIGSLQIIEGPDLADAQVDAMDRFYRRTTMLYGGRAYLRPGFFHALVEELPQRVRFVEARRNGGCLAGSLFFETEQGLYGRYWGCDEEVEFLHFEAAYYAGMDRCIEKDIPLFEAGAQGEHKLLRGFRPSPTYSAHWLRHPQLFSAIREAVANEAIAVERRIRGLAEYLPYKHEE